MKNIKNKEAVIILRLEQNLKTDYLRFCKENGYSLSKRIRVLLENDMKNGK
jgi:antitoxin component of RelBE/YafQ-DinJ toxin-antitoxin module